MAFRSQPVNTNIVGSGPALRSTGFGLGLALLLFLSGGMAIAVLAWMGGGLGNLPDRTGKIISSAVFQAGLSTLFSGAIAVPAAVTLNRQRHAGLTKLLRLVLGLAMVIPTTVAATGLLEIWGRNGVLALACSLIADDAACDGMSVYGMHGVVLAHMFFNIPLLIWIMLPLLESIPHGHWRVARHLGFDAWSRFRFLEFPALRQGLLGGLVLVFLLCFTSFALVLMLGGGPRVTTLEVEIYAAIRFSFDFKAAASLSLVQFGLAALVVMVMALFRKGGTPAASGETEDIMQPFAQNTALRLWDGGVFALMLMLIFLPVLMVVLAGLGGDMANALNRPDFMTAAMTSITIALSSAVLTLVLAFVLASTRARVSVDPNPQRWQLMLIDAGVMLYLVIPSIVLGTAAFILLRHYGDVFRFAFAVVVMANTLLALPLGTRLLEPRLIQTYRRHDRLSHSLGIKGKSQLFMLTLPVLHREMGQVLGLAAALSVGDLGVIALFASNDFRTLPWLLYQVAGSYRVDIAASLALILLVMTMLLFISGRLAGRLFKLGAGRHA